MAKKKTPKNKFDKTNLPDWHLWNEVTRTINPLQKKTQLTALNVKQIQSDINRQDIAQYPISTTSKKLRSNSKYKAQKSSSPPAHKTYELNFGKLNPKSGNQFAPLKPSLMIEPKLHRRVRRGRVPIDATIDLHGLNKMDARFSLIRFVEQRYARNDRTLLVITGKGLKKTGFGSIEQHGVLRHMLPVWLKEPEISFMVSGLETSAQHHGGEGAYYVRLKRKLS